MPALSTQLPPLALRGTRADAAQALWQSSRRTPQAFGVANCKRKRVAFTGSVVAWAAGLPSRSQKCEQSGRQLCSQLNRLALEKTRREDALPRKAA
jgi:hypothetical protein